MSTNDPDSNEVSGSKGFSDEQKNFLQGFTMGADVARTVRRLPVISDSARHAGNSASVTVGPAGVTFAGPDQGHFDAFARHDAEGKKLCNEEKAKREKNSLEMWDEIDKRCQADEFPKGTDNFLTKAHGLFYVAPAQNAYMCRMRVPGGHLTTSQVRGIADVADNFAGGYADVTTRANFQLREIPAKHGMDVLMGLRRLGIVNQGAGADNVRNVTSGATSGFDTEELIETLPLAEDQHWHLINNRDLYGLPRKFNISFDGAGTTSPLSDTNDVGYFAVNVTEEIATEQIPAGVYFRLGLGGITGHKDFARPTTVLVPPKECCRVSAAILRVFIRAGDRTDRKKARLKYLLDAWGFEKFIAEVEKEYGQPLLRMENDKLSFKEAENRFAHVGFHPQIQPGKQYVGVIVPVGRITSAQLRSLSDIADKYGDRFVRLTVWQNLLIPFIDDADVDAVKKEIEAIGLEWSASSARAGLVACTGSKGCKYAGADTKGQALILAKHIEDTVDLDQPLNIHVTGCHHSCAQHYIGDIGLMGTAVTQGEDMVDGYHVFIGGGYGARGAIARQLFDAVAFEDVPPLVERVLTAYLDNRQDAQESFVQFASRCSDEQLQSWGNAS